MGKYVRFAALFGALLCAGFVVYGMNQADLLVVLSTVLVWGLAFAYLVDCYFDERDKMVKNG